MKELIFYLSDKYFMFDELEKVDQPHIDHVSSFDDQSEIK